MVENFKNNPLLRTILVLVIGMLAFGLLFNTFSGGENRMGSEHMGNMGSGYGYSIGGLLTSLFALLVKILMIVLVVAVLLGIVVWIRNNFLQNASSKVMQSIKNDPLLKLVVVITLAIIGSLLIFTFLGSLGQAGMGLGGHFGYGLSPAFSVPGLLNLLVKVLVFVLTVSLILAAAAYLKNQYTQGNLNFLGMEKNQRTNPIPGAENTDEKNTR